MNQENQLSLTEPVGLRAVQSLSIDIANLTSRLAVLGGMVGELAERAAHIDQSLWNRQPVEDNGPSPVELVTMPGTEADKIEQLLNLIRGMG